MISLLQSSYKLNMKEKQKANSSRIKSVLKYKRLILGILGVVLFVIIGVILEPSTALSASAEKVGSNGRSAMIVLGSLVWAICWWVGTVVPDWATGVVLMLIWTISGTAEFGVSFSQYSGSIVWLLIGAFLIAGAVNKTGALKRISLMLMKIFPASFRGQMLALMGVGTIISPLVPSSTAKAVLGSNLALSTGKAMKFGPNSKGMTGLFMSAWVGWSLTVPAFMTASAFGFMLKGALPKEIAAQITFGKWFITMLPWLIVLLVGMFIVINILYKPEQNASIPKEYVQQEIDDLGKMSTKELLSIIILVACIICWILEKRIGVAAEITALVGAILCFLFGVLEPKDLSQRVSWPLIVFVGAVIQLGNMFGLTGINGWLTEVLKPIFLTLHNRFLMVIVVVIVVTLVRFLVASQGANLLLFVAILTPVAISTGINPWIMGLIVYVSQQLWFAPYQSTTYTPALGVMEGNMLHSDAVKGCFGYVIVSLVGLLISTPYWMMLGYM